MTPYDRVTAGLRDLHMRHRGTNWQCPTHDDHHPSLSVSKSTTEDGDPTVLLKCHAGCSTTEDILPALGLQPADLYPGTNRGQGELFAKARYSPVGIDIYKRMPPGAERSFSVASALGRYVSRFGGRGRVTSQRQIAAVVVESKHRRLVVEQLGIKSGTLRNEILKWRQWGIAHKCSTAVLALLVRLPEDDRCPYCSASLPDDVRVPEASVPDDATDPSTSLIDDALRHDQKTTHPGFSKELIRPTKASVPKRHIGIESARRMTDPNLLTELGVSGDPDPLAGVRALELLQADKERREARTPR